MITIDIKIDTWQRPILREISEKLCNSRKYIKILSYLANRECEKLLEKYRAGIPINELIEFDKGLTGAYNVKDIDDLIKNFEEILHDLRKKKGAKIT